MINKVYNVTPSELLKEIYVFANQKGGVGKTTCSASFAFQLAKLGFKVLFIDHDPQANGTFGFGFEPHEQKGILYHIYSDEKQYRDVTIKDLIIQTKPELEVPNLFLIPSNVGLAISDRNDIRGGTIAMILYQAVRSLANDFDYIVIDAPPSLGRLAEAAITAATRVIIPVEAGYYAMVGMSQLTETISIIQDRANPNVEIGGVFINKAASREQTTKDVIDQIRTNFQANALNVSIPRDAIVNKGQKVGFPPEALESTSKFSTSMRLLTLEILNRESRQHSLDFTPLHNFLTEVREGIFEVASNE